ncbi:hypothetical protein RchiOBHm_Chr2g0098901 [Rosa chinensis]|uniref:Uncharacterized protein n=1 Tax=Rosa chinensis TaxID=74649 RepID=A0A2P6RG47_ROSCH|nr:hypothetical protein RchiOBHm_Chr3g0490901 [Rosa chinensis]PRQ47366.1 hypothetical protein RchiOBHm_Chr2g0098901 [Rosa chinensis]
MPPATEEPNKTASSTRFMSSRPRTSSISSRTRPMMTRSRPSYGLTPPQPTPLPPSCLESRLVASVLLGFQSY